jgi:hypothetical protein
MSKVIDEEVLKMAYEYYGDDVINTIDIFSVYMDYEDFIRIKEINNIYIEKAVLKIRKEKLNKICQKN